MKTVTIWAMMVLAVTSPLTVAVPTPKTQQIMLNIEPELLKGHKLVLTLEPLAAAPQGQEERATTVAKATVVVESETSSVQSSEQSDAAPKQQDQEETKKEDKETATTEPSASENTTTPVTRTSTKKPSTLATRIKPGTATLAGDSVGVRDFTQFLLNFPNVKCPPGQRPDASMVCREPFKPFGNGKALKGGAGRYFLPLRAHHRQAALDPQGNVAKLRKPVKQNRKFAKDVAESAKVEATLQ